MIEDDERMLIKLMSGQLFVVDEPKPASVPPFNSWTIQTMELTIDPPRF
jgi:hypothetical protein